MMQIKSMPFMNRSVSIQTVSLLSDLFLFGSVHRFIDPDQLGSGSISLPAQFFLSFIFSPSQALNIKKGSSFLKM